jgi:exopolyphosphatase/guanosine-5'-triphosphate,3'-diphosphate pyrophosphatase
MKIAAIDLGTNTFHLIIAEKNGSSFQIIYKTNQPIRLGEDITKDNLIIPIAFERGINCLKEFKNTLEKYNVVTIKATGTSGIRSAINGQEFVNAVKEQTGIEIDIIGGDDEAQFIYEGVKLSGAISATSLIMDIGGGSTEFILCDEDKLIWKKSYNIGAARLMQKFFKSDPLNTIDKNLIFEHLANELKELQLICNEHQPQTLIGSAGAFETFTAMIYPDLNIDIISVTELPLSAYKKLAIEIINSSHEERTQMKNLIPLRVDMIVMAALQINYIIENLGIQKIKLSTYDLKMGVLKSLCN